MEKRVDPFLTKSGFADQQSDRAYDNAVVLRETGSEALSYIQMSVYDMENAAKSEVPLLELQQVLVNIHAFWGIIVSRHKTCH